jgi:hypothetical protein
MYEEYTALIGLPEFVVFFLFITFHCRYLYQNLYNISQFHLNHGLNI